MQPRLSPSFEKEIKESLEADIRVWELLDLIAAEFESDPMSVQCFDLRIVDEVITLVKARKKMNDSLNPFKARQYMQQPSTSTDAG